MTHGHEAKIIGEKKYCIDLSIGARKANSVMVMIIIHIAYIIIHIAYITFNGSSNTVVG